MKTFIPVSRTFYNEDDIFIFSRNVRKSGDSDILSKKNSNDDYWYSNLNDLIGMKLIFHDPS